MTFSSRVRLLAGAAFAMAVLSGTASAQEVLMRRPLPGTSRLDGSTQTPPPAPTPTPTPTPTPDGGTGPVVTPTPTPPGTCPQGSVCSVPTPGDIPDHPGTAYGWYVHCMEPELATCYRMQEAGGDYEFADVDASSCAVGQSAASDQMAQNVGLRRPGQFYDFTKICNKVPDQSTPDLHTDKPDPSKDPADPGPGPGVIEWIPGPWEGPAQCGVQSTMTRTVGCQRVTPGGDDFPGGPGGGPPMIMMSLDPSKANAAETGIKDAWTTPASMVRAQFFPGFGFTVTPLPVSYCLESPDVGPMPATRYEGTNAGCDYDFETIGWTQFEEPDRPGVYAGCSATAVSTENFTCRATDGSYVPRAYCVDNIREGGTRNTDHPQTRVGNFESCKFEWRGWAASTSCSGSTQYTDYRYQCYREDGGSYIDSLCDAASRPKDGPVATGSCAPYIMMDNHSYCPRESLDPAGRYELEGGIGRTLGAEWRPGPAGQAGYDAARFCNELGATCCEVGIPYKRGQDGTIIGYDDEAGYLVTATDGVVGDFFGAGIQFGQWTGGPNNAGWEVDGAADPKKATSYQPR